jgi:hypothetical protein
MELPGDAGREPLEQRDYGRTQQNQRNRYCHENKVLRHVGREVMVIEHRK